MNNINDILNELDLMLEQENDKNSKAEEAMRKAEELKARAVLQQQEAMEKQKRIEEARRRVEEAKSVLNEIDTEGYEKENENNSSTRVYAAPIATSETKSTNKKNRCGICFLSGALAATLLATGAWVLSREVKKGNIKFPAMLTTATDVNSNKNGHCANNHHVCDETNKYGQNGQGCVTSEQTDVYDAGDCTKYIYNYDNNVVTVTTGVSAEDAKLGQESSETLFTTENTTDQFVEVEGVDRVIVNPVNQPEIDINGEYVELTTERFEDLTTGLIKKYEELGLQVSREKLIKYVMVRNIDKLKQDNPELVKSIIGTQTVEKVYTDFEDVISAITTYNWLDFDRYHDVNRLLSAADGVFDETQKAKVVEIEKRVHEIGRNYQNEEVYNELTYSLLRDMINPLSPLYGLEDGVSLGVQWIDTYLVRARFGTDRYIKLHVQVNDLIKQFITFPEDEQRDFENAVATGNMAAVKILLNDCLLESSKILVK